MRLKICVVLSTYNMLNFIPTIANATVAFKIGDMPTQNGQLVNMDAAPYLKAEEFLFRLDIAESLGARSLPDGYKNNQTRQSNS